eukprot:CAMPEP_0201730078 /NCGR_PEP_ID=MMETSP0593-20130828/20959_1 /ASSEMBLY_ACC=CAM_ASM_000672 /TAXON_ID=267983 /ORGANISM="Skeletonema japonicum, Strain CCMP2506" /LENGTH=40 /DNA_ID= /DNA_START= /DNA_END= /DNA_ORIENTATION=
MGLGPAVVIVVDRPWLSSFAVSYSTDSLSGAVQKSTSSSS